MRVVMAGNYGHPHFKCSLLLMTIVHYDKKKFITLARQNTTAEQWKSLKELSFR